MRKAFTLGAVVEKVTPALLDTYFTNQHVTMACVPSALATHEDTYVLDVIAAVLAMPAATKERVHRDWAGVHALASKSGYQHLIAVGHAPEQGEAIDVVAVTAHCTTTHDRVFWMMLHHTDLFEEAVERVKVIGRKTGWVDRELMPLAQPPEISDAIQAQLAEAVKTYFNREGRGEFCVVRCYRHGEHTYYCAYPMDYADVEQGYRADGTPEHRIHRPTFDVFWRFNQVSGRLSIHMDDAGKPLIDALTEMFIAAVLPGYDGRRANHLYAPDVLAEHSEQTLLERAQELYPDLLQVKVTEFMYELPGCDACITVKARRATSRRATSVRQVTDQALNRANTIFADSRLVGASVQFKFPGTGNAGSVTTRIKAPDYCDLDDQPNHRKVQHLLAHLGVDHGRYAHAGTDHPALS